MLNDTDPAAAEVQRSVLEAMGPAGRFALMAALSDEVIDLALAAIAEQRPEFSREAVMAEFVERHYGADLARGVRTRLGLS